MSRSVEHYRDINEIKADVALVCQYENMTDYEAARGMPADHYYKYWVDGSGFKTELRAALTADIPLDELEVLCNAWRDGRVVVLPCKPTDAYYHRSCDTGELELNIEVHGAMPDERYREVNRCAIWE